MKTSQNLEYMEYVTIEIRILWRLSLQSQKETDVFGTMKKDCQSLQRATLQHEYYAANCMHGLKKVRVQGLPQSQTTALARHQEEEETDKTKKAQIEPS